MESLIKLLTLHAQNAHWYAFAAILLAGFNIPISIDLVILLCGFIAATLAPEHIFHLYFCILIGCYLSAMCAYWTGRLLGAKLFRNPFFSKLMPTHRIERVRAFYERHGLSTLVLGRFIPFGVRNCIFMAAGMSKANFIKFIFRDAIACSIWCSSAFFLFYSLGQNYEAIWQYLKTFNLLIFSAFSVTVISLIWYKGRKKARLPT